MKGFELDEALLRQLADVMAETGLTEIEMADGERSLRVAKQAAAAAMVPAAMPAAVAPAPAATADSATASSSGSGYADADLLNSPMVGTGYLSPEPGAAPFIKVGDQVTPDKTVMIIEAMKVMNPIRAHKTGTVTQVLITDGQPVEFGEPLIVIE
ncbi:MAG TPA: acetyl-CoA carboxylase biotin carboxyl carrier protein [Rhodospirillaceae bacterium]|nr:acetyl-CoA carboxylase, biotin carboxyl carrier protein [Alphaproteobacteria bacterium]OUT42510.1 MAG: acetyl-CoA carboxylase, biotin carboxyl carrier protein [Micavibrio sp. TMED2]HCI46705.1 acetyl-CoA carboxylase biotin carboxyl carrier protein [Rhodospirillaceae bacterium]MAS45830.1 acetyl-CoA carboxylase, biotin carboxyl carrier protein [Alphaproteobacteria bacterium]MAX95988.1 acetyl-CoA carboxylase, biotin carboxyl carrier protein [Alphaproteobacteria bacterium]|tara:strand:- start:13554 stop:14018 length:465 start_codon:yes stop_codon:yes gene_type:complete